MVDKKDLNDFFGDGSEYPSTRTGFIRFLYDKWVDVCYQYKNRRDWGTKKDWIELLTGNKNSDKGRKFVDELINSGWLVGGFYKSLSNSGGRRELYWSSVEPGRSKDYKRLFFDTILPKVEFFQWLEGEWEAWLRSFPKDEGGV